ncbi:MAG: phosphatase PAP2 family protein [Polaromonas sp.]|uniref:phosphatase PAP2 family protein n=1 Tax=Polaromonas sp. TaxID=1869339 RepID=UPI0025E50A16|nr:phosphatase PAP2 family protein [Polaromonas sp.]MBI2724824.1 phosphatase PAP2 family protein [Polaromonas sp.]
MPSPPPASPTLPDSSRKPLGFVRARLSPEGYLGLHLTIGMMAVLLAVFVFANIAEDVMTNDGLVLFDERVLQWLRLHATPTLTALFIFVTTMHNTLGVLLMTCLLAMWMGAKKRWDWVLLVLLSVPLGMLLNWLLKSVFQRDRPIFDQPILTLVTYSFPSGHTAAATLFYGVLAAWLLTLLHRAWWAPVVVVAAGMVLLVALSRVYLGVHYPSDVLAAMASSTAWLAITFTGVATWRKRQRFVLNRSRPT